MTIPRRMIAHFSLLTVAVLTTAPALADNQERVCERLLALAADNPRLDLFRAEHEPSGTIFVQGYYTVFENRDTGEGREIDLALVVLPARTDDPQPDPMFILHGGPGAGAISLWRNQINGWIRQQRDVVLIDQRGTGSSNALRVPIGGNDDDLQTYFQSFFRPEVYEAALPDLQTRADLSQYTTINSVDDFDEIRQALGYEKINLRGGSYGTRSALVYMREHPQTIRSAMLQGVQPISYRNPLPHARSAQDALDQIFEEIRSAPRYVEAFPDIEAKFQETLDRIAAQPVEVTVSHPKTAEDHTIVLDRNAFAEAVRLQLYSLESNRRLPLMLMRAHAGDYRELAEAAMAQNRAVRNVIAWGMLMCVTGSEDLSRIDPAEIEPACAGTFLGTTRIAEQMAVHAIWPSGTVPDDFGEPVSVDVPVLFLSGTHDPSTSSKWGAEAARHMPRSLHVVIPGGHGVFGPVVRRLEEAFLDAGSVEGLDLSEVKQLRVPPLVLPGEHIDQRTARDGASGMR